VTEKHILLKVLLRQRHLQGHRSFCREYDRVAARIDKELVGTYPSKAQFYRWISGDLIGLPYPDHCRILESMFPGWKVEQLFEPDNVGIEFFPESVTTSNPVSRRLLSPVTNPTAVGGISAAFTSRSDFTHHVPPHQLFDGARQIRMGGLSLNLLCQQYPDRALLSLLDAGTLVDCLFLDPAGEYIAAREREEGHPPGTLSTLTDINIRALRRVSGKLSPDARGNLRIRTYDEVPRFNITIIDDAKCVVQPYLPDARGVESPTLVIDKQTGGAGLFETFTQVFASLWARAKEVSE